MAQLATGLSALLILAAASSPARSETDQADACRKIVDALARQDVDGVLPLLETREGAWTPAIREQGKAKIRETLSAIGQHMGGTVESRHPLDMSTPGKSIVGEVWRFPKGTLAFGCTRIQITEGWRTELAFDTDSKKMADQLVEKIEAAPKP
jgi:hypothetical protein